MLPFVKCLPSLPTYARPRGCAVYVTATALLIIHATLVATSIPLQFPTIDEPRHLAAGVADWRFGKFKLNRGNPPLANLVAAAPVVLLGPDTDWSGWPNTNAVAKAFATANRQRYLTFVNLARWTCLPFSLIGALACFLLARDLFGNWPASRPRIWCFCPYMLGYGQLINADMAATAAGISTFYVFHCWLKRHTWTSALLLGTALGIAELTKFVWVCMYPMLPLLWLMALASDRCGRRSLPLQLCQLVSAMILSVYVINLGYGFDGSLRRLGDFADQAHVISSISFPAEESVLAGMRIPFPEDYVRGIIAIGEHMAKNNWGYLRGEWNNGGWWYYYIYALLVKLPVGTIILAALGTILVAWDCRHSQCRLPAVLLILPAFGIITFVTSVTTSHEHSRYIMPAIPFLYILGSRLAWTFGWCRVAAILLCFSAAVSSLVIYPHSLSYFNEVAGGPINGHRHLLHTNVDLGQDLLFLKHWLAHHPDAAPVRLAYFGGLDPSFGEFPQLPIGSDSEESGWYAISTRELYSRTDPPAAFQHRQPVARAGYSILIYHVE